MEEDVAKTVIKTLRDYLNDVLPLDPGFIRKLDHRDLLASDKAPMLVALADKGDRSCIHQLITYMEQFYTEQMLLKLCVFLREYAQPARPRLAIIASRIEQEISKHKPQLSQRPVPEDLLHRSAGAHDYEMTAPLSVTVPSYKFTRSSSTGDQPPPFKRAKSSILDDSEMITSHTSYGFTGRLRGFTGSPSTTDQPPPFKRAKSSILGSKVLLQYEDHFVDKLISLSVVLGVEEEAAAILATPAPGSVKYFQITDKWMQRTPNPTWEKFCSCLKGSTDFARVRAVIEQEQLGRHENLLLFDDSSPPLPPTPPPPTWTVQYKKAIEQRGSVTLHITRCVLIGPPRVGKSSLKLLLINNEPPDKEVEKSTDLMEAPVVLTSLQCQDKKGSQWKELTTNSLQQLVIKSTREAWYDPGKSSPIQSSHASQLTSEGSTSHVSTAVASDTDVSRTTVADSLNTSTHLVDSELEVRYHDFVDTKLSGESLAELKLNGLKVVHVFDCGGQLAFQDTIPLLINAPCAFISVFNASIDLDEEVELKYCPEKGEELSLGYKESQWNMLRRIFSSIHSLQFKCHDDILHLIKDTEVVPSSPIAVVGTHKDVLREASKKDGGLRQRRTEEKIEDRLDRLRDSKLYDFLREGCTHDLVTNQFKDDLSAIESLRKDITESKATLSLELPLSWIILELFTRNYCPENKFIPFRDLQQLCIHKNIVSHEEEFSSLLQVLHVLGFYAFCQLDGVPEDQNWVCTDAATLYKEVTKMLVVQYKKNIKKGATIELQRYGRIRLNKATLRDVFTDLEINIGGADPMWFIRVLLHIGLAAKIEDEGQEAAFIPLALPFKRSDLPPVTSVATLCFTLEFPSGASKDRVHDNVIEIPRGIFPRLIVYLLSPQCLKEFKWQVDKGDSHSRIKLTQPSYEYTIYLSEHIDHIELDLVLNDTFLPTLENVDMCTTKAVGSLCQGLRKHLVSALGDTFVSVFGKQPPERRPSVVCGLKCSVCPNSSHMAIVRPAEKSTPQHPLYTWKCVHGPRIQFVKKPDQLIWFSPEKETTFKKTKTHDQNGRQWMIWVMKGTDASKLDVTVVESLSHLLPYLTDMTAHLFELAAALGVEKLTSALINGHGTPQDKCLQILSHWLESTPSPTWALLCQKLRLVSSFKAVVHKIATQHNLPTAD